MTSNRNLTLFSLMAFLLVILACAKEQLADVLEIPSGTTPLPENPQRRDGDPIKGYDYLKNGDFIGGGIPYDIYSAFPSNLSNENLLARTGDNANIPPGFNVFTTADGAKIVGGVTCFGCHATKINGQFIPGLGNSMMDFTQPTAQLFTVIDFAVRSKYKDGSPERKAFDPYFRGAKAVAPYTVMPFKGINPAFMLEQAGVAHRTLATLAWNDNTVFPLPANLIGSDVPPLWNVSKKYALYYNGMGRGDFTKLLMQVAVVAVEDTVTARRVNNNFKDVLAWLQNLKAPAYPGSIDATLAASGSKIYSAKCAACHGQSGAQPSYPNLLVNLDKVGTDPAYANYFLTNPNFNDWYTKSWYGQSPRQSAAKPSAGYVAPPLDGVWATAPYLHNGSVPTLEDLLNSPQRPQYWRRSFDSNDYDLNKVGWKYTVETGPTDANTYNTQLSGYGNQGHTFSDSLTPDERKALLEYLKKW
jgi:mono/diheme cytochrome c family protein